MNNTDRLTTMACPHCRISIYVWFVKQNGRCPSCQKEINEEDEVNDNSAVTERPSHLVPVMENDLSDDDILNDADPSLP